MEIQKEPVETRYELGDDIGRGQFATVKRCIHRDTRVEYAAKFIRKRRGGGRRGANLVDIQREIEILSEANHANIINLYEVFETNREVILILELVGGGELFEYLAEKDKLSEEEASAFIKQILDGVEHLHSKYIAHLDLKPENILLQDKNSTNVKLIDFGLSRRIMPSIDHRAMLGTAEFVAPEVVSYEPLSVATDMWSIGVITYILLSGASPFLGDNQQETYHNITSLNFDFDEEYFNGTSDLAKDFIRKLFIKDQRKRATIHDCLNHPWIKPVEKKQSEMRRSSIINTEHLKAFIARQRWKQSMRVVSLCNRLSRSLQLRRLQSNDTLDSKSDEHKVIREESVVFEEDDFSEQEQSTETDIEAESLVETTLTTKQAAVTTEATAPSEESRNALETTIVITAASETDNVSLETGQITTSNLEAVDIQVTEVTEKKTERVDGGNVGASDNGLEAESEGGQSKEIDDSLTGDMDITLTKEGDESLTEDFDNPSPETDNTLTTEIIDSSIMEVDTVNSLAADIDNITVENDDGITKKVNDIYRPTVETDISLAANVGGSQSTETDDSVTWKFDMDETLVTRVDNKQTGEINKNLMTEVNVRLTEQLTLEVKDHVVMTQEVAMANDHNLKTNTGRDLQLDMSKQQTVSHTAVENDRQVDIEIDISSIQESDSKNTDQGDEVVNSLMDKCDSSASETLDDTSSLKADSPVELNIRMKGIYQSMEQLEVDSSLTSEAKGKLTTDLDTTFTTDTDNKPKAASDKTVTVDSDPISTPEVDNNVLTEISNYDKNLTEDSDSAHGSSKKEGKDVSMTTVTENPKENRDSEPVTNRDQTVEEVKKLPVEPIDEERNSPKRAGFFGGCIVQ